MQTLCGWDVIFLNDNRQAEAPEGAAVREELAQTLQNEAIQARIDELTQSAQIDRPEIEGVTPGIVRQLDLIQE